MYEIWNKLDCLLFIHLAFSSKSFLDYTFFIILNRNYLGKKTYRKSILFMNGLFFFLIKSCYRSCLCPPLRLYLFPLIRGCCTLDNTGESSLLHWTRDLVCMNFVADSRPGALTLEKQRQWAWRALRGAASAEITSKGSCSGKLCFSRHMFRSSLNIIEGSRQTFTLSLVNNLMASDVLCTGNYKSKRVIFFFLYFSLLDLFNVLFNNVSICFT